LPISKDELELIVIDDCSTDDTIQLINDFRSKIEDDSNLILVKQEKNQRQGAARNRGIEIARGEYIAFADADDEVVADGVMNALTAVAKSHADICYFDFEYEQPQGVWNRFEMPKDLRLAILSSKKYLNDYYTCWYNAPWRNIYRTDFLRSTGIRFIEGVRWEDCDWTVKVYSRAKDIQFVNGVGYRYGFNPQATSKEQTSRTMAERIYAGGRLVEYAASIKSTLPGLATTLDWEGRNHYVIQELRLRNVTKYSAWYIRKMYGHLGKDQQRKIGHHNWPMWVDMMLNHRLVALMVLFVACPISAIGRKITQIKRKI